MNDKLRDQLTIVNAFIHDVATGTWISSLVVMLLLSRELALPEWSDALAFGGALARKLMVLTWTSLAIILATGVVRMLTWKVFGWTGDVSRDRIRLLKVKHAVLGMAFVAGTAWMAALAYS